jgi:hypothetical protein
MFSAMKRAIGKRLAGYLSKSLPGYRRLDTVTVDQIASVLKTGDIILVEGNTRISTAIKYLTQSSWSHSALFIGRAGDPASAKSLLEADLKEGVRLVSLEHYKGLNLRICRPVNLTEEDSTTLVEFALAKLGHQYDLRNIKDLLRYLVQKPAVPNRYRRAMLSFGSGEPTKAICSTLVAESFQHIHYPILPVRGSDSAANSEDPDEVPIYYKRHFTHFTPRDFDLSPYFQIVKATIEHGFSYQSLDFQTAVTAGATKLDNSQ